MDPQNKSKVDDLSDTLYSRTRYQDPSDVRSIVKPRETADVEEKWNSPELNELLTHERVATPINPAMKKFFVFAVLFFIATLLVAAFVFLGGANFISSKNVDIAVVGPTTASAGEVVELGVTIENKNNTDLELANFSVQYPEDSRDPLDSGKGLTFTREDLGVIEAGAEASRTVRMVLLGSVGEVKEIKFSVEYKVRGSNATFYKDKIYEITIGDAPLSITVESPPQVSSGDLFDTELTVRLNSTEILKNVMLRAEYPYGYSVESSEPAAIANNNIWALGDLSPGSEKSIKIRGRLVGENQDERTFRFYVGVSEGGSASTNFKTVLVSSQRTVAIERPSISLNPSFNGESSLTYIAPAGQNISTAIKFQNNLPEKLLNPVLTVRLSGQSLNPASVTAQNNGVYSASNGRISWTLINSASQLALSPGEGGTVTFNFASYPENMPNQPFNRDITLQFSLTGTSAGDNKTITVTENRTVKVGSQVTLSSQAVRSLGPFSNIGTVPPKVGKDTSYTILWSVSNTYDNLSEAKVTAKLGLGIKWTGAQTTAGENISYDQANNTVTWTLGDLASGIGFSAPARSVAFQVTLTPTAAQVGSAPTLVNSIVFLARDTILNKNITVSSPALTTRISNDPAFIQGDDIVVK